MTRPKGDPILRVIKEPRKRAYLRALAEVGYPHLACRVARAKTKDASIHPGQVNAWKRDDPQFAAAYVAVHREFWDAFAQEGLELTRNPEKGAKRLTGGEANLRMQALNRAIPEEYLPPIVTQQHQTVSYKAEMVWGEEPAQKEPKAQKVPKAHATQAPLSPTETKVRH